MPEASSALCHGWDRPGAMPAVPDNGGYVTYGPGDHNTILSKRGALVLGETLRGCLLEAQAQHDRATLARKKEE